MSSSRKIAICGLGSIGARHLRNLSKLLSERGEDYTIDIIRSSGRPIPDEYSGLVNKTLDYGGQLEDDYDIIFVTNPTMKHYEAMKRLQGLTKSMFVEKPVFADLSFGIDEFADDGTVYYVACPVRFKQVIQHVKNEIACGNVLSAIAICSSYLPDWRPGTDYRNCYSSIAALGGGVSLDLIHEIDYIAYLLGDLTEVHNVRGHVSSLDIDCEDVSAYTMRLESGAIAQVYLDYIGRADIRKLLLFTREDTVEVDLLANTVDYKRERRKLAFEETRDDFQIAELEHFLAIVDGMCENDNDLARAYKTLGYTLGVA